MWLFDLVCFSILQIWYIEVQIYWSISESPLDIEITRVDYLSWKLFKKISETSETYQRVYVCVCVCVCVC